MPPRCGGWLRGLPVEVLPAPICDEFVQVRPDPPPVYLAVSDKEGYDLPLAARHCQERVHHAAQTLDGPVEVELCAAARCEAGHERRTKVECLGIDGQPVTQGRLRPR